jgi:heptosyltransferase III
LSKRKTILIFRTGQLGDTLVAMPAISVIRKNYPDYKLVLLTDQHPSKKDYVSSWDILGPAGWFDEVVFYNPSENFSNKIKNMLLLAKRLRAYNTEYIYDLSQERTSWQSKRDLFYFRYLIGTKNYRSRGVFVDYNKNHKGALPRIEPEWQRLLKIAGLKAQEYVFHLNIPDHEEQNTEKIFDEEHIDRKAMLLALAPGSKRPTTKWPIERFAELGKRLLKDFEKLNILILGGKEDIETGEKLSVEWGNRAHNLAGRLSVYGSAAALKNCLAFVGNDTGTMHLAGILRKPCVAIFSARNYPGQWEPYGNNHLILRHKTECSGCRLDVCNTHGYKCLFSISVDEVFSAVSDMLVHGTPRQPGCMHELP